MEFLAKIPILTISEEVVQFAEQLVEARVVPAKVRSDALHIAVAAVNGIEYLLTWNCTHIANAAIRGKIEEACRAAGLRVPIICTPEELMEE